VKGYTLKVREGYIFIKKIWKPTRRADLNPGNTLKVRLVLTWSLYDSYCNFYRRVVLNDL